MYRCVMCKTAMEGNPALINGAGSFCGDCKKEIYKRAADGCKSKIKKIGACRWCGDREFIIRKPNNGVNEGVCTACENNREWLLKCIRFSHWPHQYVNRIEEREKPIREARIREQLEKEKQEAAKVLEDTPKKSTQTSFELVRDPHPLEGRLDRLETMLTKLTEALGGL